MSQWILAALALLAASQATFASYRCLRAERGLRTAKGLLGDALAAEQSAVRCREVGAFDDGQRDAILAFLGRRDPRDPGQEETRG